MNRRGFLATLLGAIPVVKAAAAIAAKPKPVAPQAALSSLLAHKAKLAEFKGPIKIPLCYGALSDYSIHWDGQRTRSVGGSTHGGDDTRPRDGA